MSIQDNYVVIMAGGVGSRLWPESRSKKPKQFLDVLGVGKTLLQMTYQRFVSILPSENIFVLTIAHYKQEVVEQLPEIKNSNIITEPFRRNTAPGAAYAAYKLVAMNPQAKILLTPSDHLITDERTFERSVYEAFDFVGRHTALLTFGIKPTRPDTGYGYIQLEIENEEDNIHKVKTFTEKPNLDLARTFLKSGDFVWNSGIFAWQAKALVKAVEKYLPDLHDVFLEAKDALNTDREENVMHRFYMQCTNISIDYGIMEKANNVYVLPAYFGWSDIGNWEAVYENVEKDYLGNAVVGKNVMIVDASECIIKSDSEKLTVIQGLDQFVIIDTPEVLLICDRNRKGSIKELLAEIKRNFGEKYL